LCLTTRLPPSKLLGRLTTRVPNMPSTFGSQHTSGFGDGVSHQKKVRECGSSGFSCCWSSASCGHGYQTGARSITEQPCPATGFDTEQASTAPLACTHLFSVLVWCKEAALLIQQQLVPLCLNLAAVHAQACTCTQLWHNGSQSCVPVAAVCDPEFVRAQLPGVSHTCVNNLLVPLPKGACSHTAFRDSAPAWLSGSFSLPTPSTCMPHVCMFAVKRDVGQVVDMCGV
jgi:hypothetical protein